MNTYEQRMTARRERYEQLAQKSEETSAGLANRAHDMASVIPFGQPILVGHHSEGRDRNYRAKIHATIGRAVAAQKTANYYSEKAKTVGTGGISSDDPEVISKLKQKLEELETNQSEMKVANKSNPGTYRPFELSNNNANIRRIKGRIESLEKIATHEEETIEGPFYICKTDKADNRIHFIFEGRPVDDVKSILKSHGFKWSPTRTAWVRQLNGNGMYAARQVIAKLNAI